MNSEGTNTNSNNSEERSTPPAKPEGGTETNSNGAPAKPENTDGTAPEMCNPEDEDCEVPEMPSGEQGGPNGGAPGEMTMVGGSSDNILHPVAYLALGGSSVIVAMAITYACFSKFFRKKPGQTFDKGAKFAGYCIGSIILAAGIIALCYFIPIWVSSST